ncbi:MAG: hypothetical protein ABI947_02700 [Chloroflexota bacterium]
MKTSSIVEYSTKATRQAQHRREMLRQVYLPIGLTALLLVVVPVVLLLTFSPYQLGTVSSFMSLLMLIPAAVLCIIPYVALAALVMALWKLNVWLPDRFALLQNVIRGANSAEQVAIRIIVRPIIWLNSQFAALESLLRRKPKALPNPSTKRGIDEYTR